MSAYLAHSDGILVETSNQLVQYRSLLALTRDTHMHIWLIANI